MLEYFEEKGRRNHWCNFQHAFLGISMLNPHHHGEKFEKIVEWVNRQKNFKHCFVYLADSLYRHHFMMLDGMNERDAYERAIHFGDKWLKRHSQYLEKINVPYRVIRWDEHWQNPYMRIVQDIFYNEYENNNPFQKAVLKDIKTIFSRRGVEINHILPRELAHSRNFILEELSVDSLFFQKYKIAWIYPGKELGCYTYLRKEEQKDFADSFKNYYPVRLMSREVDEAKSVSNKKAA